MYSQNNEQQVILDYFFKQLPDELLGITWENAKGMLIDIGANDGIMFSNSRALIERGWHAFLVEPNPIAFEILVNNNIGNVNVSEYNFAIGNQTGEIKLYCNTPHIDGDIGLLSTTIFEETKRWPDLQFNEFDVPVKTFADAFDNDNYVYDFITIDAEGMDFEILSQIDLAKHQTKMVCVEHNGNEIEKYIDYCTKFGMSIKLINAENLIMAL